MSTSSIDEFIKMIMEAIMNCQDDPKRKCILYVADDISKEILEEMIYNMDISEAIAKRIIVEKATIH